MSGARHVDAIANRLSLRAPQRDSLAILARVCELIELEKAPDLSEALAAVRAEFPEVTNFDRDFPSLCFALATGVGKTRLMGAFIAWLHRAKSIRNFFVLAPNLTIYEKLIRDFTPNTPKYVFTGLAEFATEPPEIITGDNYEQGRGVRKGQLFGAGVHINVFNISKINAEVRGGSAPRIKRLAEYIGQSYFEYLAELPDLVLLMDESHRYRASAGVRAINELKPILGLELTATPRIERGANSESFGNVIYSYALPNALADGFIKEPAVATRQDFRASGYDETSLERLKLEDGIRIHEDTKVQLEAHARNQGVRLVKPFVLVVASDTTHAAALQALIEGETFFEGRYKGKVITVHSKQGAEEKDEVVQQLLSVEDPANPVEIVIHVNMLKEGWDVTNLYTIVPLRAANSRLLVEQSIGRGLRLPYGQRVGVDAVDRLTIVAHDRFQEIVDHARDPNSILRRGIIIGKDVSATPPRLLAVQPAVMTRLFGSPAEGPPTVALQQPLFTSPRQERVARQVLAVLPSFEKLPSSRKLLEAEIQAKVLERVLETLPPEQGDFTEPIDHGMIVRSTIENYIALTIDIPRVVVTPRGETKGHFEAFRLELGSVRLQPAERDILIRHLENERQYRLDGGDGVIAEPRPEDYLVRVLVDYEDVSYDEQSELLYDLAGQVVQHLRTYLSSEEEIANVLQYHGRTLGELVHAQMQPHWVQAPVEFDVNIAKGFVTAHECVFTVADEEKVRDFRNPVHDRQRIRQMVFGGFKRSSYPVAKFDSDSERRFAALLETDEEVQKWLRPVDRQLSIHLPDGGTYLPDFVVETADRKFLCEVKARNELDTDEVRLKARAAALWCQHASAHAAEHGTKPWAYLLIPHDEIEDSRTLGGLRAMFTVAAKG